MAPVGRRSITSRRTYSGLKILPKESYEKILVHDSAKGKFETHFACKHSDTKGEICNRTFVKSTSLIVHYLRHINLRPFVCIVCNLSFT